MQQIVLFIEAVAAIAVLASIVYLAIQIRDSSRSNRAAAVATLLSQYDSPNSLVSGDIRVARIFRIGFTGSGELNEDEQTQFQTLNMQFMTVYHAAFRFYQDGILDKGLWLTFRRDLVEWTNYPGLKDSKEYFLAYYSRDPEYAAELELIFDEELSVESQERFFKT